MSKPNPCINCKERPIVRRVVPEDEEPDYEFVLEHKNRLCISGYISWQTTRKRCVDDWNQYIESRFGSIRRS